MTDYQFQYVMDLKDKCAQLSREIELLRQENSRLKQENEELKKIQVFL